MIFKENCPDTSNSKVEDIIKRLGEYGIAPVVVDLWADPRDAMCEYGVTLTELENVQDVDCIILAVAHSCFKEIPLDQLLRMYGDKPQNEKVLIDVKNLYSVDKLEQIGILYWRL